MENFVYLKKVIVILEKFLAQFGGKAIPCTQEEVDAIESKIRPPYHLPAAFKEYLFYGGRGMGEVSRGLRLNYDVTKDILASGYKTICRRLLLDNRNARIPSDIFGFYESFDGYNFTFLLLSEGENPPIYCWEEDTEDLDYWGDYAQPLGSSIKVNDSFSDFFKEQIRIAARRLLSSLLSKQVKAGSAPRGEQFWIPYSTDILNGIIGSDLMKHLGYDTLCYLQDFQKAAALVGLDQDSYLEELSGWKCHQVDSDDDQIRFFPPQTEQK